MHGNTLKGEIKENHNVEVQNCVDCRHIFSVRVHAMA